MGKISQYPSEKDRHHRSNRALGLSASPNSISSSVMTLIVIAVRLRAQDATSASGRARISSLRTLVSMRYTWPSLERGGPINPLGDRQLVRLVGADRPRLVERSAQPATSLALAPLQERSYVLGSDHRGHDVVAVLDDLRLLRSAPYHLREPLFGLPDLPCSHLRSLRWTRRMSNLDASDPVPVSHLTNRSTSLYAAKVARLRSPCGARGRSGLGVARRRRSPRGRPRKWRPPRGA